MVFSRISSLFVSIAVVHLALASDSDDAPGPVSVEPLAPEGSSAEPSEGKKPVSFGDVMLLFHQFPEIRDEICRETAPGGGRRLLSVSLDDAADLLKRFPSLRTIACTSTVDEKKVVVWDKCCGTYNRFKDFVSKLDALNNPEICSMGNTNPQKKQGKVVACEAKGKEKLSCLRFKGEAICKATKCSWDDEAGACHGEPFNKATPIVHDRRLM